jgi:phosphoribosylformylglycinamidine (FGAM) synthase-like enzyme
MKVFAVMVSEHCWKEDFETKLHSIYASKEKAKQFVDAQPKRGDNSILPEYWVEEHEVIGDM